MDYSFEEVQMNSAGLAADRYKIHMESLEAKISSLKASAEKLYQQLIRKNGKLSYQVIGCRYVILRRKNVL